MGLIVRIDVDRPYGRQPLWRHVLSRIGSDLYLPRIDGFGYLTELAVILQLLNERGARAHAFFRQCTLPSPEIMRLLDEGGHGIGLHLEDSRSESTFAQERRALERYLRRPVTTFSKHGSGGAKFGRRHHAPYEPALYVNWARDAGMTAFLGNLEDPTIQPSHAGDLVVFPAAFWLEPHWRDTNVFTIEWLLRHARHRDIVLLIHPENVLESESLTREFTHLVASLPTALLAPAKVCA